jgi:hypothetical protein
VKGGPEATAQLLTVDSVHGRWERDVRGRRRLAAPHLLTLENASRNGNRRWSTRVGVTSGRALARTKKAWISRSPDVIIPGANAYSAAGWENFLVAETGAAAALAGLLFVAVSINLSRIVSYPGLPGRAGVIFSFGAALIDAWVLLVEILR